jgi:phage gp45-like
MSTARPEALCVRGTTIKTATDVETDTQDIQARLPAALGANGNIKADVRDFNGTAGTFASGRPEVNMTHIAGTAWASTTLFTLASHDPGATIGTSTLTQTQVTGGAYALNSASFAFNAALDLTTTQKASVNAEADTALADVGLTTTITGRIDAAVSTRSTLTQTQVTGGAYALNSASFAFNAAVPAAIADAVWDEAISGHLAGGSTGAALNAAGSAGDPWATVLPGAYGAGTAGLIVGTYLDMALSDLPTATENADALLNRDMSAVSDTNSRSPLNALRFLRNKWSLSGVTLTVTKENDSTTAWDSTVSTSAGADPIVGSDPT